MFLPKSHHQVAHKNKICTPSVRNWGLQTSQTVLWRVCMRQETGSFGNTVCTATFIVKGKGKDHPRKSHEDPEGDYRDNSTLSLTSALEGVRSQRHAPATLPPGNTRYPLYRRLDGPQGRAGRVRKISPPPGFDPRAVQPVASHYTDWATLRYILIILLKWEEMIARL